MASSIFSVHSNPFSVQNPCEWAGEPYSGLAFDYWTSVGVEYSWAIELQPNSSETGNTGGAFTFSPELIAGAGEEVWVGMKGVLRDG